MREIRVTVSAALATPFWIILSATPPSVTVATTAIRGAFAQVSTTEQRDAGDDQAGAIEAPIVERRVFYAKDDEFEHPISIPDAALPVLLGDAAFQQLSTSKDLSARDFRDKWLLATEISVADGGERSVLIKGKADLLPNPAAVFWILHPNGDSYEMVLHNVAADELELLETRTAGYRDLEIRALSPPDGVFEERFSFDGRTYTSGGTTFTRR
jgi:hypothetical protein